MQGMATEVWTVGTCRTIRAVSEIFLQRLRIRLIAILIY